MISPNRSKTVAPSPERAGRQFSAHVILIAWMAACEVSLQLTRGLRALKVWMALKHDGTAKLGRLIQQNVDQAAYLAGLIKASEHLRLLAPVALNVVCFRYTAPGLDERRLDAHGVWGHADRRTRQREGRRG